MLVTTLEPVANEEEKKESLPNKEFHCDFLDGFRGTLALWVLIGHLHIGDESYTFSITGHYIGVNGFFILSSFLLTYRLMDELLKKSENYRQTALILLKYIIRRIFRIYLPFVFTVTLIKCFPKIFGGIFSYPSSWFELVFLKYPKSNHLWTISTEIKYYAIIPIFCLALFNAEKSKNFLTKLANLSFLLIILYFMIENLNWLSKYYLGVFLNGSLLAVVFRKTRNFSFIKNISEKEHFCLITGFISMVMYMYGVVLSSLSYNPKLSVVEDGVYALTFRISIWWTIVIYVMLIGSPNFFNNLFETTLLRSIGKYSFGVYLFHPMCIEFARKTIKTKFPYEYYFYVTGLSFCVGFLFYHFIENKMIKKARDICNKLSSQQIFQQN